MSTQGKELPSEASSAGPAGVLKPNFDQFRRFWQSPEVERTLLCADIESNIAHVRMLGESGIVEKQVSADVIAGLEQIRKEMAAGIPVLQNQDVDIHSAI